MSKQIITINLSQTAVEMLSQIALLGIYGTTPEEVAARFVDTALSGFIVKPVLKLTPLKAEPQLDPTEVLWRGLRIVGFEVDRAVVEALGPNARTEAEQWVVAMFAAMNAGGELPPIPSVLAVLGEQEPEVDDVYDLSRVEGVLR